MMDLLSKFQAHWKKEFPGMTSAKLLLAVSGGLDSMVLVDLIARSGFDFRIAHANFQLRGEESKRDEILVKSLEEKYGKEVYIKKFDTKAYVAEKKISVQEAARDLRYDWFSKIIGDWNTINNTTKAKYYIVTAHHADDAMETMLMHFFRGTGIQGLTGIPAIQKERHILRPLLSFRKKELSEYAILNGIVYAEDSSNASDKYTRNFFRNRLIPQIKEVFPQVEENLFNNLYRFGEISELYRQSVQTQVENLIKQKGTDVHIPVLKWKKIIPLHTLTWELIRPYGFSASQTDDIIKLLDAGNGSYRSSGTHRIIRNRNWMIITPIISETSQHILIEPGNTKIVFEQGYIQMDIINHQPAGINHFKPSEAWLSMDTMTFPLVLRKWKQGDYFYPLGMQKKKKLNRFFIDQKLSKTDKEKVWVLESNQKIIWVIGYRIDNRYKLTEQSRQILHISYRK